MQLNSAFENISMRRQFAVDWPMHAQDATPDGGFSYGYYFRGVPFTRMKFGWRESYIETTGYIAEAFFDLAARRQDESYGERALRAANWLLTRQNEDGSFSNDRYTQNEGIVFDTGQVLFGLVAAFKHTGEEEYLTAARRAADWLVQKLDPDGAWRRNTHNSCVHTYNTRTAWAVLELSRVYPNSYYELAARKNLDWALTQLNDTDLFENCGFTPGDRVFTHTIAYAVRGLLEGGLTLGDQNYLGAAHRAARRVAGYLGKDGFLPGDINENGEANTRYACLTGNCQMAIIWYKLFEETGDRFWLECADAALSFALHHQNTGSKNQGVRGALAGSYPFWGKYTPLAYPNWATKFLLEALLQKEALILREQN